MYLKKKLMYSGIVAAATLVVSILIPIIPCRIAPGVPNPVYKWALCSLNPDNAGALGSIKEYFGTTASMTDAYLLTILITFAVVMVLLHYTTKKKKKN